jgi:NAD(P)-dependent dehydrogenase (short-subunit alcohol dehydrogenase family)
MIETKELSGRRALITGSAAGIGRAMAETLAEAGASVVCHGLDNVAATAADWRARGLDVCESRADLSRKDGVKTLQADIAAWGQPDILVLNASVETLQTWADVDDAALDGQSRVNIDATVRLIQAFLPAMIEQGWGRVIAIGTVQEARPQPRHFIYAATKAAQTNMILNLARQGLHGHVTFNIVKPGAIPTDRNRATLDDPVARQATIDRIPLRRLGAPGDCAGVVRLLCSQAGAYINGAEIAVDGGLGL